MGEGMSSLQWRPALSFVEGSAVFILLELEERPSKKTTADDDCSFGWMHAVCWRLLEMTPGEGEAEGNPRG